ncbi:uncharacterized protein EI97DRAFT_441112 [Westerdykella ornata]|uniref:Uncharacterized protein n=1 Tax=Westerdykella ornata TaxID=318751 RepID=A0A6A6JMD0_WESOR|nr:uncharacterized protein EI97DRAFT_441112 [Westerdykella ornata]KAF2277820.1 hypothetical protein EI97DRAFT_441112 [Westerdykella ornata]
MDSRANCVTQNPAWLFAPGPSRQTQTASSLPVAPPVQHQHPRPNKLKRRRLRSDVDDNRPFQTPLPKKRIRVNCSVWRPAAVTRVASRKGKERAWDLEGEDGELGGWLDGWKCDGAVDEDGGMGGDGDGSEEEEEDLVIYTAPAVEMEGTRDAESVEEDDKVAMVMKLDVGVDLRAMDIDADTDPGAMDPFGKGAVVAVDIGSGTDGIMGPAPISDSKGIMDLETTAEPA